MAAKNHLDNFLEFEDKHDLFSIRVQGIFIWEYIRNRFYYEYVKHYGFLSSAPWEKEKKEMADRMRLFKAISTRLNQVPKLFQIIGRNISMGKLEHRDLLVLNFHRRYIEGIYHDCKYTEEFLQNTPFSYYVLESSSDTSLSIRTRTRNLIYPQVYFQFHRMLITIKRILLLRFRLITVRESDMIEDIFRKFNDWFDLGGGFDSVSLHKEISKIIRAHDAWETVYRRIIGKVRPKAIIYVARHAYNRKVITEIARRKNIPTIEFQHGIIGSEHISFNYLKKRDLTTYPEYIFVFGELWKQNVRFPIDEDHVIPTGMPYMDKKIGSQTSHGADKKHGKTLLFLSQSASFEKLADFACALYDRLNGEQYHFIFKLHPLEAPEYTEKKKNFQNRPIEVVGYTNHDLYYFFSISDYVISVFSTSLFEAIAFNIPVFVAKAQGHELLKVLYENNYATLIDAPEQMINMIHSTDHGDSAASNEKAHQAIWQSNAIENMNTAISKIISRTNAKAF